jgi:hypothetical protein
MCAKRHSTAKLKCRSLSYARSLALNDADAPEKAKLPPLMTRIKLIKTDVHV